VKALIERHMEYTGSVRARKLLDNWSQTVSRFVKILPKDYKRYWPASGARTNRVYPGMRP